MPSPESLPAALPLIAYAEHLCKGAKVLISAENPLPLAKAVLARGARLVHVLEPDNARRREAEARSPSRDISFGASPDAVREGLFDLALVDNLGRSSDPTGGVRALSRLVAPRGAALIAAANPEARTPLLAATPATGVLDYYALYDAVAAAFAHVRMLGQVPFVGYALIDFAAEGEPEPVFDTTLLADRNEEPDYFVALGSQHKRALDGYVVVQVPSASVLPATAERATSHEPTEAGHAGTAEPPRSRERELEQQLARQEAWIAELEARAEAADARADAAEAELDELREQQRAGAPSAEREHEPTASVAELERLGRRVDELSNELARQGSENDALRAELALKKSELDATTAKLDATKAELDATKGELEATRAELEAAKNELTSARTALAEAKTELAALTSDTAADEVAKLEAQLREQGARIRKLERELREAERTGRELVRKLTSDRWDPAAAAVAERLVEAEAELVGLRWSLQMLGQGPTSAPVAPGVPR